MASPSPSESAEHDHFARFGLPRAYPIDRDALEHAYLTRAAAVHPDRFAQADSGQQRAAMEASAALNEGYRVLRDPVQRAEYLVKLAGIDLDDTAQAPAMPRAFLVEMIESRELLEETRGTERLAKFRDEVEGLADTALDVAIDALAVGDPRSAAQALVRRRYLARLLDEIEAEER